ncbi:MAG: DNA-binding protein [Muribaculaceae bacterium]|nr:DNA-binding protein [Muribaculaceae bacterium]
MAKQQSKGFLLRLDPETMALVERWAAQEFRSVNGQIQWIIADALRRHGKNPKKSPKTFTENEEI